MNRKIPGNIALGSLALIFVLGAAWQALAGDGKASPTSIAPLDQYLMADRNAEIALARSAAPESISHEAQVLVLGQHGYEIADQGKNGFVCVVERSWMAPFDDPEFLNPDQRLPLCLNPPAARSHLPLTFKRTELALAGLSKTQMFDSIKAVGAVAVKLVYDRGTNECRASKWHDDPGVLSESMRLRLPSSRHSMK